MMSEFGETYLKTKGLDQASNAYNESLQIYLALAIKEPGVIVWQREIADQIDHLGLVRQKEGKIGPAMDNFRQALEIRRAIVARESVNAISYSDLRVVAITISARY